MHIDSYQFGEMIIDGKSYTSDLIIFPEAIKSNWWRKEGHLLQIEDLAGVVKAKPEVVVIGQGASGFMMVPVETKRYLERHRIKIIAQHTAAAYQTYNKLSLRMRVVGLFHLTC